MVKKLTLKMCLCLILFFLNACGIPKPPAISGVFEYPNNDLGVRKEEVVQKVNNKSYNVKLNYYGNIAENQQIEYWYFAQNADLVGVIGQEYLVARAFYDLEKIGVNCHITQCFFVLDNSQYSAQMFFAKGNGVEKLKQQIIKKE